MSSIISSTITQVGLSSCLSASPNGPLISIDYFLPCYDWRIDPTLNSSNIAISATSAISAWLLTTSANSPFGELLYNTPSYSLSTGQQAIISAAPITDNSNHNYTYTNALQSQTVLANLLNNNTLSPQIFGNWVYNSTTNTWTIIDNSGTVSAGSNSRPTGSSSDFYEVVDYFPVLNQTSGTSLAGSFKCLINANNGSFKFNKIALYSVSRTTNGTILNGGTPVFFGECYLNSPVVKSSLGDGFDSVMIDCQINLSTVTSAFTNVFYSTSADYWQLNGPNLHSGLSISVGAMDTYDSLAKASVHIRRAVNSGTGSYYPFPHLRIEDNSLTNNSYFSIEQSNNNVIFGGQNLYQGNYIDLNLIPNVSAASMTLGTIDYPFRSIFLSNDYLSTPSSPEAINIEGIVKIGLNGVYNFGMKIDPALDPNNYGSINGFDIRKTNNSLLIMTDFNTSPSQDIWLISGVNSNATYNPVNGQVGLTHQNLQGMLGLGNIATGPTNNQYGISNVSDKDSNLNLVGRGRINMYGPVCLDNCTGNDSVVAANNGGLIYSRKDKLALIAGIPGNGVSRNSEDVLSFFNNYSGISDSFSDNSEIDLVAGVIKFYGDILPLNANSIGNSNSKLSNVYAKNIYAGTRSIQIGNIVPNSNVFGISRGSLNIVGDLFNIGAPGFGTIDNIYVKNLFGGTIGDSTSNVGSSSSPIANGYFTNLYATSINGFGYWTYMTNNPIQITGGTGASTAPLIIVGATGLTLSNQVVAYTILGNTVFMNIKFTMTYTGNSTYFKIHVYPNNFTGSKVYKPVTSNFNIGSGISFNKGAIASDIGNFSSDVYTTELVVYGNCNGSGIDVMNGTNNINEDIIILVGPGGYGYFNTGTGTTVECNISYDMATS